MSSINIPAIPELPNDILYLLGKEAACQATQAIRKPQTKRALARLNKDTRRLIETQHFIRKTTALASLRSVGGAFAQGVDRAPAWKKLPALIGITTIGRVQKTEEHEAETNEMILEVAKFLRVTHSVPI